MIIIFFDTKGIVHKEFIQTGHTVHSAYYSDCIKMCKDFALNFGDEELAVAS
jgi:hypothetical protein